MLNLDLGTIAACTGGTLRGLDLRISSVSTDTRKLADGALFVALRGERHDAHDFLGAAAQAGAVAAVV
ncbi:MAG: UDP-N-acetylmuramoylalanyl-D-glutamyl-2, 6-diaminopimelate--D-alanyl-D-alanine ligase, partial [Xanthomonadales bacterium]|nr:UDP-N-acetylmuramoylalanyl-D-glutamyl-2, 6-diaminopimelate--D-alanyl-D-alanine ligase [Xanthomonadales bacterium]